MTWHPTLFDDGDVTVHAGDCIKVMATLDEASIDVVITDPPYGLEFMGRKWDKFATYEFQAWCETWGRAALRVLKPGGHLLAFGGTRTFHRLTCGIEDAGFEIRDVLTWLYGSGFPKSLDVSKAIDKAAGAERHPGVEGPYSARRPRTSVDAKNAYHDEGCRADGYCRSPTPPRANLFPGVGDYGSSLVTTPATDAARQWDGWGTALKPAWEPIILARKPLAGTVARNVTEHGTGALNIDACRIDGPGAAAGRTRHGGGIPGNGSSYELPDYQAPMPAGRWPANVAMDEDAAALLDAQATGGPSRFFYTGKASRKDRGEGNTHPTVKPSALMRWLVRLATPPGGVILDPFAGSGTTGVAAVAEGRRVILVEREPEYLEIIANRLGVAKESDDA